MYKSPKDESSFPSFFPSNLVLFLPAFRPSYLVLSLPAFLPTPHLYIYINRKQERGKKEGRKDHLRQEESHPIVRAEGTKKGGRKEGQGRKVEEGRKEG
jgi:hypothetical protein